MTVDVQAVSTTAWLDVDVDLLHRGSNVDLDGDDVDVLAGLRVEEAEQSQFVFIRHGNYQPRLHAG